MYLIVSTLSKNILTDPLILVESFFLYFGQKKYYSRTVLFNLYCRTLYKLCRVIKPTIHFPIFSELIIDISWEKKITSDNEIKYYNRCVRTK